MFFFKMRGATCEPRDRQELRQAVHNSRGDRGQHPEGALLQPHLHALGQSSAIVSVGRRSMRLQLFDDQIVVKL